MYVTGTDVWGCLQPAEGQSNGEGESESESDESESDESESESESEGASAPIAAGTTAAVAVEKVSECGVRHMCVCVCICTFPSHNGAAKSNTDTIHVASQAQVTIMWVCAGVHGVCSSNLGRLCSSAPTSGRASSNECCTT
jgi:hypothetical protein